MQRLLWLFLLAGCPPPPRYVVADVTAGHRPLEGALVVTRCGDAQRDAALRTDEDGIARVQVFRDDCSLLVAKPGYPTVETGPVNVCPNIYACSPMRVDLTMPPYANPIDTRYARPPMEVAR
jgi:hypothetical protein